MYSYGLIRLTEVMKNKETLELKATLVDVAVKGQPLTPNKRQRILKEGIKLKSLMKPDPFNMTGG